MPNPKKQSTVLYFKDDSAVDADIWDDTALEQAYDQCIKLAKSEVARRIATSTNTTTKGSGNNTKRNDLKNKSTVSDDNYAATAVDDNDQDHKHDKNNEEDDDDDDDDDADNEVDVHFGFITDSQKYKIGDYVRCTYDDGIDYEAEIISITNQFDWCTIQYIGYNNVENVYIKDLVESWGKMARKKQRELVSLKQNEMDGNGSSSSISGCSKSGNMGCRRKQTSMNKQRRFDNKGISNLNGISMPPIPPMPPFLNESIADNEHLSAMIMSYYMAGYHTGLYHAMQKCSQKD